MFLLKTFIKYIYIVSGLISPKFKANNCFYSISIEFEFFIPLYIIALYKYFNEKNQIGIEKRTEK